MLSKAISIVAKEFIGANDKGGKPYVLHCLHVMYEVERLGNYAMQAAVMHDLLEDTKFTSNDLKSMGFSPMVITLLEILTHDDEQTYDEYIKGIINSGSMIAMEIKLADLRHNSDIHRMKGLRAKDFQRLEKYHRSYAAIQAASEKL